MPDRDTTPTRDTAETGGGEDDHPSIKRQARDAVHEAADAAAEHARQFAVEAKQRVKEKAKEARDALQAHVRERMKEQAVEAADRKRSEIAADVHTVAEALRTASTKSREDGKTDRLTESVASLSRQVWSRRAKPGRQAASGRLRTRTCACPSETSTGRS